LSLRDRRMSGETPRRKPRRIGGYAEDDAPARRGGAEEAGKAIGFSGRGGSRATDEGAPATDDPWGVAADRLRVQQNMGFSDML
ncbi:MAG: hypothetical protein U1A16_03025, partial [Patescibacteria group bacterium]|nr:hypothetical protein [Patescibacteria group bacterium]